MENVKMYEYKINGEIVKVVMNEEGKFSASVKTIDGVVESTKLYLSAGKAVFNLSQTLKRKGLPSSYSKTFESSVKEANYEAGIRLQYTDFALEKTIELFPGLKVQEHVFISTKAIKALVAWYRPSEVYSIEEVLIAFIKVLGQVELLNKADSFVVKKDKGTELTNKQRDEIASMFIKIKKDYLITRNFMLVNPMSEDQFDEAYFVGMTRAMNKVDRSYSNIGTYIWRGINLRMSAKERDFKCSDLPIKFEVSTEEENVKKKTKDVQSKTAEPFNNFETALQILNESSMVSKEAIDIFKLYYGIETNRSYSQMEIGEAMNASQAKVSKILASVIQFLQINKHVFFDNDL